MRPIRRALISTTALWAKSLLAIAVARVGLSARYWVVVPMHRV